MSLGQQFLNKKTSFGCLINVLLDNLKNENFFFFFSLLHTITNCKFYVTKHKSRVMWYLLFVEIFFFVWPDFKTSCVNNYCPLPNYKFLNIVFFFSFLLQMIVFSLWFHTYEQEDLLEGGCRPLPFHRQYQQRNDPKHKFTYKNWLLAELRKNTRSKQDFLFFLILKKKWQLSVIKVLTR